MNINDKIFAFLYDLVNQSVEPNLIDFRKMTAGYASGNVLEIGAGTGANFRFYKPDTQLTVLEKNEYMFPKIIDSAIRCEIDVTSVRGTSYNIPFADNSFDSIVTTLVLCTVDDLESTILEIKRVLKPGGAFYFYEHVKSKERIRGKFEDYINPMWRYLTNGCNLNRDLAEVISGSGFTKIYLQTHQLSVGLPITIPNIVGNAVL
ncbi:MAG: class I SAM-dependent methyltransferase [SAR202 cluster bacterium]|nr:class I SAM-dependent methyltransferase [SAR202 cluster bacterium]|tara:strand:+ start:14686 stop:15300 length:615 start_codon:yes stop_codon:yes gene_type:complete